MVPSAPVFIATAHVAGYSCEHNYVLTILCWACGSVSDRGHSSTSHVMVAAITIERDSTVVGTSAP